MADRDGHQAHASVELPYLGLPQVRRAARLALTQERLKELDGMSDGSLREVFRNFDTHVPYLLYLPHIDSTGSTSSTNYTSYTGYTGHTGHAAYAASAACSRSGRAV